MATPQNSGNTAARPNDNPTNDQQLKAAMHEAGAHPERAQALAEEFGICQPSPEKGEYDGEDCIRAGELAPITNTVHHEVLGYLASWRVLASNGGAIPYWDMVSEHHTYLVHSPHFREFLDGAKRTSSNDVDPNWHLAGFGAEMFAAGMLAARREFGRRPPTPYDLEFDQVTRLAVTRKELSLANIGEQVEGGE